MPHASAEPESPTAACRANGSSATKRAACAALSSSRPARMGRTKVVTGRCTPNSESAKIFTSRPLCAALCPTYSAHHARA